MRARIAARLREEDAGALVENIVILPLVFLILFGLLLTAFIAHDKATLEAAAKRGAIYAARCIADPKYEKILSLSGNSRGDLDTNVGSSSFVFSGIGRTIKPYRYITGSSADISGQVEQEVRSILDKTRFPWRGLDVGSITYTTKNTLMYQSVSVEISARYPLPALFETLGFERSYSYSVSAKMTVNDPDEFIRNADLVVDMIIQIDSKTGGHLSNAVSKVSGTIEKLTEKLKKWMP